MQKNKSKTHEVSIEANGIVKVKIADGAHIDVEALEYINVKTRELAGSKKVLALIDARQFHTMTPEAANYLKNEIVDKTRIASAVVSKKLALHIMVDNMTKVQKIKSPMKVFSSEARAIAWLLSFKRKSKKDK